MSFEGKDNMGGMDEFLRKALEGEMHVDETEDNDILDSEVFKAGLLSRMGIMASGKLIKIGKAAVERKIKVIKNLAKFLNESKDKYEDQASWQANTSLKIQKTAKEIAVLDTLMAVSTFGVMRSEDEADDIVESVVKASTLI